MSNNPFNNYKLSPSKKDYTQVTKPRVYESLPGTPKPKVPKGHPEIKPSGTNPNQEYYRKKREEEELKKKFISQNTHIFSIDPTKQSITEENYDYTFPLHESQAQQIQGALIEAGLVGIGAELSKYRLFPKLNPNAHYRQIGKEGYKDAIEKQILGPNPKGRVINDGSGVTIKRNYDRAFYTSPGEYPRTDLYKGNVLVEANVPMTRGNVSGSGKLGWNPEETLGIKNLLIDDTNINLYKEFFKTKKGPLLIKKLPKQQLGGLITNYNNINQNSFQDLNNLNTGNMNKNKFKRVKKAVGGITIANPAEAIAQDKTNYSQALAKGEAVESILNVVGGVGMLASEATEGMVKKDNKMQTTTSTPPAKVKTGGLFDQFMLEQGNQVLAERGEVIDDEQGFMREIHGREHKVEGLHRKDGTLDGEVVDVKQGDFIYPTQYGENGKSFADQRKDIEKKYLTQSKPLNMKFKRTEKNPEIPANRNTGKRYALSQQKMLENHGNEVQELQVKVTANKDIQDFKVALGGKFKGGGAAGASGGMGNMAGSMGQAAGYSDMINKGIDAVMTGIPVISQSIETLSTFDRTPTQRLPGYSNDGTGTIATKKFAEGGKPKIQYDMNVPKLNFAPMGDPSTWQLPNMKFDTTLDTRSSATKYADSLKPKTPKFNFDAKTTPSNTNTTAPGATDVNKKKFVDTTMGDALSLIGGIGNITKPSLANQARSDYNLVNPYGGFGRSAEGLFESGYDVAKANLAERKRDSVIAENTRNRNMALSTGSANVMRQFQLANAVQKGEEDRKANIDYMGERAKIDEKIAGVRLQRDKMSMDQTVDNNMYVNNLRQNYYTTKAVEQENKQHQTQQLAKNLNARQMNRDKTKAIEDNRQRYINAAIAANLDDDIAKQFFTPADYQEYQKVKAQQIKKTNR
jgi:hypothetical protein